MGTEVKKSSPSSLPMFFLRFGLFELLFLSPLIFYGWATTFSMVKETFVQIGCLALICGLCFQIAGRKINFSSLCALTLFIISFGVFLAVSCIWSASFYASFLSLGVWGAFFALYFLTLGVVEDEKWARVLIGAVVASGAVSAGYSIFQFYGIELPIWRQIQGRMRLFSTFGNPNYLAGYLAASLHLGALLFFTHRGKGKFLWLLAVGFMYTALILTYTRGAWVALFLSGVFVLGLFLFYKKSFFRKKRFSVAIFFLLFFAITVFYSVPGSHNPRQKSVVERGASVINFQSSASQRFLIWHAAVELIKEKPFLGWGVGTFGVHYPQAQGRFLSREENREYLPLTNRSINAHNDYLHIWAETGLVGLFLFLGIIVSFYWRVFSFLREGKEEKEGLFLIFLAGAATSFLVHAGVSFPFHVIQNGIVFFFLLGLAQRVVQGRIRWKKDELAEGETQRRKKSFAFSSRKFSVKGWIFLGLAVAGALYLSLWRVRIFTSDLHLKQAELLIQRNFYAPAKRELEKAIDINPHNAHAFADLTKVYSYFGFYGEVVEAADRARVNWNVPNIHNRKAFAYLQMEKMEKAENSLQRCIYLYPDFAPGYINSGYLYLLEAEKDLQGENEKNIEKKNVAMAEQKLDKAFLYYTQGSIWQPGFSFPGSLCVAYRNCYTLRNEIKGEESGQKQGEVEYKILPSPFVFYSKKKYFLAVLPPCAPPEESFIIRGILYTKNRTSSGEGERFSVSIHIENEEKVVWSKNYAHTRLPGKTPVLITFPVEEGLLEGRYALAVDLLKGDEVLSSRRLEFTVSSKPD